MFHLLLMTVSVSDEHRLFIFTVFIKILFYCVAYAVVHCLSVCHKPVYVKKAECIGLVLARASLVLCYLLLKGNLGVFGYLHKFGYFA